MPQGKFIRTTLQTDKKKVYDNTLKKITQKWVVKLTGIKPRSFFCYLSSLSLSYQRHGHRVQLFIRRCRKPRQLAKLNSDKYLVCAPVGHFADILILQQSSGALKDLGSILSSSFTKFCMCSSLFHSVKWENNELLFWKVQQIKSAWSRNIVFGLIS